MLKGMKLSRWILIALVYGASVAAITVMVVGSTAEEGPPHTDGVKCWRSDSRYNREEGAVIHYLCSDGTTYSKNVIP